MVRLARLPYYRHYSTTTAPPLIRIQDASFYRQYPTSTDISETEGNNNTTLQENVNFILPSKGSNENDGGLQHWAIIGSNGRTELLDILRGRYICLPPRARTYPYLLTDEIAAKDPRLRIVSNAIRYIGFTGEGSEAVGGTRGAYLSSRYESLREETDWTVDQYLRGRMSLNPAEGEEGGNIHDEQFFAQVVSDLNLVSLLDMPTANLSNGQTRRARIAKALLSKPELLLLDEPFSKCYIAMLFWVMPLLMPLCCAVGLDPATVRNISGLLGRMAEKCSPRLILGLRPQDTLPDWITNVIILGSKGHILLQGDKPDVQRALTAWKHIGKPGKMLNDEIDLRRQADRYMEEGKLDGQLLRDLKLESRKSKRVIEEPRRDGEPLIEMDGVKVQYGDKVVLGDWEQGVNGERRPGLHWTIRRGQRWVVIGPNGSGKTTLLSMITSDHPQTYAMPVRLFGRSRLPEPGRPAISIFELQSRLGHSSPEIHAFFPRQLTVRRTLESAFASTFLSKPKLTHERDLDVNAILLYFKTDLDPKAESNELPTVNLKNPELFPRSRRLKRPYVSFEQGIEYADEITFGSLSTAQQRLVLFLRTLVHRPDIIILDEAFSGMTPSIRDKCIHFLEFGETEDKEDNKGKKQQQDTFSPLPSARFTGLSPDQALIVISHVKEEIPDSVRQYMRLPAAFDSGAGAGADSDSIDFRIGSLTGDAVFNDERIWDVVWSPASVFEKHSRVGSKVDGIDEDDLV